VGCGIFYHLLSQHDGNILPCFNSTFIALIPKVDKPTSFKEIWPISLCNCVYKGISKVLVGWPKPILSRVISLEQFGFLEGRQIPEAIWVAQEGLHSMKLLNLKGGSFLKLIYLRLMTE